MIETKYNQKCNQGGDIYQHLPVLRKYAEKCNHITEMGVWKINSTWAFLAGRPDVLVSIDRKHPKEFGANIDEVYDAASKADIKYSFIQDDTLEVEIDKTDLLFIDTWHVYQQLKAELDLHGNKVKKYIIMHDTFTYGKVGTMHHQVGSVRALGLQKAIDEFLDENKEWIVHEVFTNNNGLTILKRI